VHQKQLCYVLESLARRKKNGTEPGMTQFVPITKPLTQIHMAALFHFLKTSTLAI
jgi:hypothetical protein